MKKTIILTLALLITASAAGCSSGGSEDTVQETAAAVNNYVKQDTDTVVTGEIVSITGNMVTLALGEVQSGKQDSTGEKPESGSQSQDRQPPESDGSQSADGRQPPDMGNTDSTDGSRGGHGRHSEGEMPSFGENGEMPASGENGEMPSFGEGGGRKGGSGRSSIAKSGEEASYIIPVGMTIDGLTGKSADYSGLSEGLVISLTVDESGKVCAAGIV